MNMIQHRKNFRLLFSTK